MTSTPGNSTTGQALGNNRFSADGPTVNNSAGIVVPSLRVSIAVTTVYYGKVLADYTVAVPQARGRLSARRVR